MTLIAKGVCKVNNDLELFFNREIDVEIFSRRVYQFLGVIPYAVFFAEDPRSQLWKNELLSIIENSDDVAVIRGAFLLLAEAAERNHHVSIEFGERLLQLWCEMKKPDEWILSYVMNRFPEHRERWLDMLRKSERWTIELSKRWEARDIEGVYAILDKMFQGDSRANFEQINAILTSPESDNLDVHFSELIRRISCKVQLLPDYTKEQLRQAIMNPNFNIVTRNLAARLILSNPVRQQLGNDVVADWFATASLKTPKPLGPFLYSMAMQLTTDVSRIYNILREDFVSVARANRTIALNDIKDKVWIIILEELAKRGAEIPSYINPNDPPSVVLDDLFRHIKCEFPVEPRIICEELGVPLLEVELPSDVPALTVKAKQAKRGVIVINSHEKQSSLRNNFTLAHELGHFLLHEPDTWVVGERPSHFSMYVSKTEGVSRTVYSREWEREANIFASLLLIPKKSEGARTLKELHHPFLNKLNKYSLEWGISISALCMRWIEETLYPACLIISGEGDVLFQRASAYWNYQPRFAKTIPASSSAFDLSSDDFCISSPKTSYLSEWSSDLPDIRIYEESFSNGYGQIYTLLYES